MSKIRELLSREKFVNNLKRLGELRIKMTHAALLQFSILFLILILAFTVRLLPLRWGYYLSEFDPYWQYRLTKDMVENGYLHWTTWHDTMSWWPWGKNVAGACFPGLPLTAATFYNILNALGVPMVPSFSIDPLASDPVYNFVVIFPVIMGTLTCLAIYFLGKDIGGKEVGLFAAFFLALNASYIGRTSLGFFDDETVGIFGIVLFSLFFLRSIEKEISLRANVLYAIAAGLSLGYLFTSWGAARFPVGLTLLFVVVLLLLRRYSFRLLTSYGVTFGIALFIAINVPKLGLSFLKEIDSIAVFGLFFLMCVIEISRHIKSPTMKGVLALGLVALGVASFLALFWFGYIQSLPAKFMSVVNPFERLFYPVVSSVQEHRPAAWGSIYYDLGIGILFIPVGFYFAAQNPTNRNVYLILFGLTSIYFASAMVRLMLILAPALCLLWALALTRVLKPFITLLREKPVTFRKMRFEAHVGKEFSAAFLILVFLLLSFTFVFPSTESRIRGEPFPRVFNQAYIPTTISSASLPVAPKDQSLIPDWLDALNWMRYNLPQDAVVVSWWDYGYWITTIANKTTLTDNATTNSSQIKRIGEMFLSNETRALQILEDFNQEGRSRGYSSIVNKTYIVAFFTFYVDSEGQVQDAGYGEESKWRWMANIAGDSLDAWKRFGDLDENGNWKNWNALGNSTLIYKLMMWGKVQRVQTVQALPPDHFELIYWSQRGKASVVTAGGIHALVTIWKVEP